MESKSESSISVSSSATPQDWRARICEIQKSRMSPDLLASLQEKSERQKRAMRSLNTAKVMERCNTISARAQKVSLKKAAYASPSFGSYFMQSAPLPSMSRRGEAKEVEAAPLTEAARGEYLQQVIMKSSDAALCVQDSLRTRRTIDTEPVSEEREMSNFLMVTAQLDNLEAEVEADEEEAQALAVPTPAGQATTDSFLDILESLTIEPTDDAELQAKYTVFENFLNTVVTIREQTCAFWNENRDQFDGPARAAGEKAIRNIDNERSLSIVEDSRRWFVYFMMKQAHANYEAISSTLAGIRAKLELLAKVDLECPFCLESITPENGHTLGCCHKTCKPCWTQWQDLQGARAFCPLCRHEEFVQQIFT